MRLAAAAAFLSLTLSTAAFAGSLDIYFIDVEGGQSTLIVTPAGESLLIDAGYGGRSGTRDPERILEAIRAAHLDHIDYLLVTHFHNDHVGGVPDLAARIPISTFIDYGAPYPGDRMAAGAYRAYEPVRSTVYHLMPNAGDRLPLTGIEADVVSEAGRFLTSPLEGGGQTNAACATEETLPDDGTENERSLGVRIRFGDFRFVDLGDLSNGALRKLVCPINMLGPASVYLVAHHGNYDSNSPAVLAALRPQVAVLNNSLWKGGAPDAFATLRESPGLDVWQLHRSEYKGAENSAEPFMANVDEGESSYWIKLTASADGSFTMTNSRTGFARTYVRRHH